MNASSTRGAYNAYEANDVSMVIDQDGIVRYRGAGVNTSDITGWIDQLLSVSSLAGQRKRLPNNFELHQNYPNPFNPSTRITFEIPGTDNVSLQIFDLEGRLVKELLNTGMRAGRHEVSWNGTDRVGSEVASGIYIYRLQSGSQIQTRKMTLLR